jgi:hypothetical protein
MVLLVTVVAVCIAVLAVAFGAMYILNKEADSSGR